MQPVRKAMAGVSFAAGLLITACGERPETPPEAAPAEASPSLAAAEPPPPPPPGVADHAGSEPAAVPPRLHAVGTEPFWAAKIEGSRVTYMTPEYPEGFAIAAERRTTGRGIEITGTIDGKPLVITVTPGSCSDGMSDEVYAFQVVRTIGPDTQRGCARPLQLHS